METVTAPYRFVYGLGGLSTTAVVVTNLASFENHPCSLFRCLCIGNHAQLNID